MRSIHLAPLLCGFLFVAPRAADACGFKAGGAIGAVRFDQLNHTSNPVNIVMYANPKSEDATKTLSPTLEHVLEKIGHAVKRVDSKEAFDKVMSTGRWDCEVHGYHDVQVVLADLPDAEQLTAKGLSVVPIVSKPSEFDKQKRMRFPVVLTPSARPSSHVPYIESVARNVVKKSGPVMLAERTKTTEERTPTATLQPRESVASRTERTPVAAGPDEAGGRGGPVSAGQGEATKPAETAPAPRDRQPVSSGTTNVASRTEMPPAKTEPAKTEPAARKEEPVARKEEPVAKKEEPAPKREEPVVKSEPIAKVEKIEKTRPVKEDVAEPAAKSAKTAKSDQPVKVGGPARQELYFAPASTKLAANFLKSLDQHIKWLQANPSGHLTVEGHADRTGPADANQTLSERRAESAKAYIVSKGIAESRVNAVGYGEEKPVDPPGDSFRNRCVVVVREE